MLKFTISNTSVHFALIPQNNFCYDQNAVEQKKLFTCLSVTTFIVTQNYSY